jgi:tetratricopeptide (TPR) repeat protein
VALLGAGQPGQGGAPLANLLRRLDPRPIDGLLRRARDARGRCAWAEAAEAYAAALRRRPRNAQLWKQLGHMLKESGRLEEAEQAYRTALAWRPRDPDGLLHLGHLLTRRGRTAEAARLLARGIDLAPDLAPLRHEARRVLSAHMASLDDAFRARIDRALAGASGAADTWPVLDRVEAMLRARLAQDPHPATMRLLASLLARRGAPEEAARLLGEVLWANPSDAPARDALVTLKAGLNDAARIRLAAQHGVAPEALPRSLRFVAIGSTGLCNASCIHCPTGKAATGHVPRTPMPMPLFERIIRQIAELHLSIRMQVSLGLFGDGLVDPHVVERVRLLRRLLPDALVSVNTNAAAYSPGKHRALFEQVGIVSVHCESLRPEVYNELMAPLRLENVKPRIEAILRDFPGKVHVSVPLSRLNRDEAPELRRWFAERGAATVAFDGLSSRCATDRTVFDRLALAPRPVRCRPEVVEDLIVDCDGLVTICCQDFRREEPIGDLSRETLVETLLSPARQEVLRQFAGMRHAERSTCRRCFGDRRVPVP